MANCDPNALLQSAQCIEGCTTQGQRQAITVWLLAQIAGENADTASDVSTLLNNARCIESCLSLGQMKAIEVWLLCQIAP